MWLAQGMRVQEVVMCIHRFLDELGVDEVRQRGAADDKPLRMVKTLVHELCKCLVRPTAVLLCQPACHQKQSPAPSLDRSCAKGHKLWS